MDDAPESKRRRMNSKPTDKQKEIGQDVESNSRIGITEQSTTNLPSTSATTSVGHCPEKVEEMCGRHLHTFIKIYKKAMKETSAIRIRSDIFENENENHTKTLQYDSLKTDAIITLLTAVQQLQITRQNSVLPPTTEFTTELQNTISVVQRLNEQLQGRDVSVPANEPSTPEKPEINLSYEVAAGYMETLMFCMELEGRLELKWKTANEVFKYRIARILRNSTCWLMNSFVLNYSKSVEVIRSRQYIQAIDLINSLSTSEKQIASQDHAKHGLKDFKRLVEILAKNGTEQVQSQGITTNTSDKIVIPTTNNNTVSLFYPLVNGTNSTTDMKQVQDQGIQTDKPLFTNLKDAISQTYEQINTQSSSNNSSMLQNIAQPVPLIRARFKTKNPTNFIAGTSPATGSVPSSSIHRPSAATFIIHP